MKERGGVKGLLVAPEPASRLLCALLEPRRADWCSGHPPNKCWSTKEGNTRSVLGTLAYTEKGIAFVSFQSGANITGILSQGEVLSCCIAEILFFSHTGEMHSTSLLEKQRLASAWVLCKARSLTPHAQVPLGDGCHWQ